MYISEFQIENFKSFENVTIHFNSKTNVFTGVNNAGKSTVLEAISLWYECYTKLLKRADKAINNIGVKKGDFVFGYDNGLAFSYTEIISVRSPSYEDIFYNLDRKRDVKLTAKLTKGNETLRIGFNIASVDGANYYKIKLDQYKTFDNQLLNSRIFLNNPEDAIKVLYASPLANISHEEERQHSLKINFLKQSHVAHLAFRNRIEALFQRRNELGNPYDTFCNQLSSILLDNVGQVKFEFPQADALKLRLLVQLGSETPKDISLVGSGTLQIIEILLNIHEQKSEINLILLDEPDSHIHRGLQVKLLTILNRSDNTQIFITTHNESLIRDAQPEWLFHLEKQPVKVYHPIQRDKSSKKGLLSNASSPIIQALGGNGSGLDFITALEADLIFMVEGVNDALRIQKILSFKANNTRKFAYWVMGNVDTIFDQLTHYKNVFSEIKNTVSLWDKTVLVFDKDYLTDIQREKLLRELGSKFRLSERVYSWQAYNFDSTLFSDLNYLTLLIQRQLSAIKPSQDTSNLFDKLNEAMAMLVEEKKNKITEIENKTRTETAKRDTKFKNLRLNNIIETDYELKAATLNFINSACTIEMAHKIMDKDDCETVLKRVFNYYDINFQIEGNREEGVNLNSLFEQINNSTIYKDWEFIMGV
jgi:AAA15 family ATPase/GTPase